MSNSSFPSLWSLLVAVACVLLRRELLLAALCVMRGLARCRSLSLPTTALNPLQATVYIPTYIMVTNLDSLKQYTTVVSCGRSRSCLCLGVPGWRC